MIARQIGELFSIDKARRQVCSILKVAGWVAALLVLTVAYAEAAPIVVDHNATPCITPSVHYTTIQAAVNAAPNGATIRVCPGNYPEQVTISRALTVRGASSVNASDPVITSPLGGVLPNATSAGGLLISAQVLINSLNPVNIIGIAVDGSNNQVISCPPVLVGIYYQNTSGEVSHGSVRNQSGNPCAYPVVVETTGSASQAVRVNDSSIHDFGSVGIAVCSGAAGCFGNPVSGATTPTITLTSNTIMDANANTVPTGIYLYGATGSVSGNLLSGFSGGNGIVLGPTSTVSVSNNAIGEAYVGIFVNNSAGVQITSNLLFRNTFAGIDLEPASNTTVQGNRITDNPGGVGIEFGCSGTYNKVSSNTIEDVGIGIDRVPAGNTTTPNTYFNVHTNQTGGC